MLTMPIGRGLCLTESDRAWLICHLKAEADKLGDAPRSTRIRRILSIWQAPTQPSSYELRAIAIKNSLG